MVEPVPKSLELAALVDSPALDVAHRDPAPREDPQHRLCHALRLALRERSPLRFAHEPLGLGQHLECFRAASPSARSMMAEYSSRWSTGRSSIATSAALAIATAVSGSSAASLHGAGTASINGSP